jgi:hypothetical protein
MYEQVSRRLCNSQQALRRHKQQRARHGSNVEEEEFVVEFKCRGGEEEEE